MALEKKKTLLIIEDEDDVRQVIRDALSAPDLRILEAPDGKSGLEMIRVNKPQVILSDYNMPGLNGLELLRLLKEDNVQTPVIWLTGRGSPELFRDAWRTGVYDFFEKPADFEELRACVQGAFISGLDFNINRKPNFMNRLQHHQFQLSLELQLYHRFAEHCQKNGLSLTSMIHHLIARELDEAEKNARAKKAG